MILRTLSQTEITEEYGDPFPHLGPDGRPRATWEIQILDYIQLPAALPLSWKISGKIVYVRRIRCHKMITVPLQSAIYEIHEQPEVWKTINDFGGCYEWRRRRLANGTWAKSLSLHAWGLAIDWDVLDNPDHSVGKIHPEVKRIMQKHGFYGGYKFRGNDRDPMHWEIGRWIT